MKSAIVACVSVAAVFMADAVPVYRQAENVGANAVPTLLTPSADPPALTSTDQTPSLLSNTDQAQAQPGTVGTTDAMTPSLLAMDPSGAVLGSQLAVLGEGYPGTTYETAVAIAADTPTSMVGKEPFSWQSTAEDLTEAAAVSILTGSPEELIRTGVHALISLLFNNGDSGPSAEEKFRDHVESKLDGIQFELGAIEATLTQVLEIDSQIQMDVQDAELNNVLSMMVAPATTIDNAFSQFASYAQTITSNTTANATRAQAIQGAYTLLTSDSALGPTAVLNAIVSYQRLVLGYGGSRGVLSFVPQMVQNGWLACSMNLAAAAPNQNAALLSTTEAYRSLTNWAFHDSIVHITQTCVNSTFTTLQDQTGRAVRTVFGSILTEQLKAFALLSAAWGNDTLRAPQLQTVSRAAEAIGSAMGGLWGTLTQASSLGKTADSFLGKFAETLGSNRAGQFWRDLAKSDVPSEFSGIPGNKFSAKFVTTMCQGKPCLVDPARINFGTGSALSTDAFTFTYTRDGFATYLSKSVLAPLCYCSGNSPAPYNVPCTDNDAADKQCKQDYGPGAYYASDKAMSDDDHNGHTCHWGNLKVPYCHVNYNKVEYGYAAVSVTIPAPAANLPQIPGFLSGIANAFAKHH